MKQSVLSERVETRVEKPLKARLEAVARREERSPAAIVRRALRAYLDVEKDVA